MMTNRTTFGCKLLTSGPGADAGALRAQAVALEELGFDSIWVSDHLTIPERIESPYPYSADGRFRSGPDVAQLEPLTLLTYLAAATSRIRLGTHVLILPIRNPVPTAKIVATLDVLSGGRVDLGIGVGWLREEFEALGYDYFDRRGAVTDEQIRVMKTLWAEGVAAFEGAFYRFPRIGAYPLPMQRPHPPIWFGGETPQAIRRVARFGDGWLPVAARTPTELAAAIATLQREARQFGRDPVAIRVCVNTSLSFERVDRSDGGRAPFHGTPEELAADVRGYRDAGAAGFVFSMGGRAPSEIERVMRRFAEEVRPAVAS